jgi:hypothetical protein
VDFPILFSGRRCIVNVPVYAMLTALWLLAKDSGGFLDGAKVVGYSKPITPTANTLVGDLGLITVPGLEPQLVTWSDPISNPDGSMGLIGDSHNFAITDLAQPATITGWAVFSGPGGSGSGTGSGDTLWYAEALPVPITLDTLSKSLTYVPKVSVGNAGTIWGSGVTIQ